MNVPSAGREILDRALAASQESRSERGYHWGSKHESMVI